MIDNIGTPVIPTHSVIIIMYARVIINKIKSDLDRAETGLSCGLKRTTSDIFLLGCSKIMVITTVGKYQSYISGT